MSYCQQPHQAHPLDPAQDVAPFPVVHPLAHEAHGPLPSASPPEM